MSDLHNLYYDLTLDLQERLDDLQRAKFNEVETNKIDFEKDILSLVWFYACREVTEAINKLHFSSADNLGVKGNYVNPDKWTNKVAAYTKKLYQWDKSVQTLALKTVIEDFKRNVDDARAMFRSYNYKYGNALDIFFEELSKMLLNK